MFFFKRLINLCISQVQPYPSALDESMIASLTAAQQDLTSPTDLSRVEYFAVPTNGTQVPVHALYPYDHYLAAAAAGMPNKDQVYQAGFQAGYNLSMQQLGEEGDDFFIEIKSVWSGEG